MGSFGSASDEKNLQVDAESKWAIYLRRSPKKLSYFKDSAFLDNSLCCWTNFCVFLCNTDKVCFISVANLLEEYLGSSSPGIERLQFMVSNGFVFDPKCVCVQCVDLITAQFILYTNQKNPKPSVAKSEWYRLISKIINVSNNFVYEFILFLRFSLIMSVWNKSNCLRLCEVETQRIFLWIEILNIFLFDGLFISFFTGIRIRLYNDMKLFCFDSFSLHSIKFIWISFRWSCIFIGFVIIFDLLDIFI